LHDQLYLSRELLRNINISLAQRTRDFSGAADKTTGSLYRRSIYSQLHLSGLNTRRVFTLDNLPRGCAGHVAHDCALYPPRESFIKVARGFFLIDTDVLASSNPSAKGRPRTNSCRTERSRKNNTVSNWHSMCSI